MCLINDKHFVSDYIICACTCIFNNLTKLAKIWIKISCYEIYIYYESCLLHTSLIVHILQLQMNLQETKLKCKNITASWDVFNFSVENKSAFN